MLETAIVRSIEVREGQQVKAGEVLAKLDPTSAAADLGALLAQVSSLEAEVARIQAEAENKPFGARAMQSDRVVLDRGPPLFPCAGCGAGIPLCSMESEWRRGWDSNPRYGC